MTLDLAKVAARIQAMADWVGGEETARAVRLELALQTLDRAAADVTPLRQRIDAAVYAGPPTWLAADLPDDSGAVFDTPTLPTDYAALATDGSHIETDRNRPVACHLINIGVVHLRYGRQPRAHLDSAPTIYFGHETDDEDERHGEGLHLQTRRAVAEAQATVDFLTAHPPSDTPTVALLDGSLILWHLAGRRLPVAFRDAMLDRGLLAALDALEAMSPPIAVAAYISQPQATAIVNALRLALCPDDSPNCGARCATLRFPDRPCDGVGGLFDRDIFWERLAIGQRSAVFGSRAPVMEHYRQHRVGFFYLRLENEISRVEVPAWVARDQRRLDLVHAVVLDQCRLGFGYPVALAEAHEQAVVSGADRDHFWDLVERALRRDGIAAAPSAKSRSKQTRWL